MPTKDTARRPSGRRLPSHTPSKRLAALPGRTSKQPRSRLAALAARLRPKRSSAKGKPGFLATVGKALSDLTSGPPNGRSRGAGKKRLASLLTGAAAAVTAVAAAATFKRRRGRQGPPEPPTTEPAPETTAPTTAHQPEGAGSPAAADTTSTPTP